MSQQHSYSQWLVEDFGRAIDALELTDLQKHFLHSRWLGQLVLVEASLNKERKIYVFSKTGCSRTAWRDDAEYLGLGTLEDRPQSSCA